MQAWLSLKPDLVVPSSAALFVFCRSEMHGFCPQDCELELHGSKEQTGELSLSDSMPALDLGVLGGYFFNNNYKIRTLQDVF